MVTIGALGSKIGQEIGLSDWMLVDQAMIDLFADATRDHQFIHVDPAMAKLTPFGGTIAHGFLTLSLLSHLFEASGANALDGIRMALNYGTNKVRFLTPVRAGSRVRGRFKLVALDEQQPGQYRETVEATVEIEGVDKPALVAEWIFRLYV